MNSPTKNFPLKPLILTGVVLFAHLSPADGEESAAAVREWKSHDGKYSVKASLAGFDRATRRVSLSREDSTVVEVPLARLSSDDRSYIAERGRANPREKTIPKGKTLHGIRWQPEIEDALAVASGEPTPEDDRPVMWFRVLGELDGHL